MTTHENPIAASIASMHVEMAQRWLVRLASGAMTAEEMQRLTDWVDADPRHRRAFERERAAWRQLGPVRERLTASLNLARARANTARVSQRAVFAGGGVLAACLAWFLAVGHALVWLRADHMTRVGEVARVMFPDGSSAVLDTDSAIAWRFTGHERRVELLRGRAWFAVRHDATSPFRVQADESVAEATGTAFSVERQTGTVVVRVTDGSVAITSSSTRTTARVSAGTQALYSADYRAFATSAFDESERLGWRSKRVVIERMPLSEALAEIDRYLPGSIVLLDSHRAELQVSGTLTLDTLEDGLEALASSQGLRVVHLTPYLTILH